MQSLWSLLLQRYFFHKHGLASINLCSRKKSLFFAVKLRLSLLLINNYLIYFVVSTVPCKGFHTHLTFIHFVRLQPHTFMILHNTHIFMKLLKRNMVFNFSICKSKQEKICVHLLVQCRCMQYIRSMSLLTLHSKRQLCIVFVFFFTNQLTLRL